MRSHPAPTPRTAFALLLSIPATLALVGTARAQGVPPRIDHVFPMGGKAGSTVELKVAGIGLDKVEGLHFNFPGVRAEALDSTTVAAEATTMKKKGNAPAKLQAHRFKVALPADAPPGIQDVRIVTAAGISNPRAFVVGDLPEVNEQEPNDDVDKAQPVSLNTVVNGVIAAPTDVDYYAFTGKKGQRVVCSCRTSSIDSKLPVALEVFDRSGASHGANHGYAENDAVLDVTLPADGEYLLRVSCFTYTQGGIDYFYRLQVSTTPWIDAVFPPAVEPGREAEVTVFGRNLPGGTPDRNSVLDGQPLERLTMKVMPPAAGAARGRLDFPGPVPPLGAALAGFTLRLKNDAGASNPYLLTYARAPVVLDAGDNDTREKAQKVSVPCEIAGRIEKRGDVDWYAFPAQKGAALMIEARGERLGSPLDLYFQVVNDKGAVTSEQDDTPETMVPQFSGRSEDPPPLRFVPPAAFTDAGPRHLYTVRIGPEDPDFQVVAMPASLQTPDAAVVGTHGSYAYNVHVWRMGGFVGDITLSAQKLPRGLSVVPQVLAGTQKQTALVVTAAADAAPFAGAIEVIGTAMIDGKTVTREVRGATIVWPVPQPNVVTVTRLDRELVLAVRDQAPYSLAVGVDRLTITQGEKVHIPLTLQVHQAGFKSPVQLTAAALPPGVQLQALTLPAGKDSATAVLDPKGGGLVPGKYTIVLRGQTQANTGKPPPPAMKGGPVNYVQATPPIELTVLPRSKKGAK